MDDLATAYHEAGHAVMAWILGEANHIDHVTIRPNEYSLGRVQRSRLFPMIGPGFSRDISRSGARREVAFSLAGPSAEDRVAPFDPVGGWWWFDELMEFDVLDLSDETTDGYKAAAMAALHHGDDWPETISRRAWRFLRETAAWCDEMFREPEVWSAVERLADVLVAKRRVSGRRAWRVMERGWPGKRGLPLLDLDRKWRRRFFVVFKHREPAPLLDVAEMQPAAKGTDAAD